MHPLDHYRSLAAPRVVGIMSGTSADAVDAALVEMGPRPRLLVLHTEEYDPETRRRLFAFFEDRGSPREMALLHVHLGRIYARAARRAAPGGADLVACHGQTVVHLPTEQDFCGSRVRATLQLGEAAEIAAVMGCPVVSDFRPADLALGGQGAPLVPLADAVLLRSPEVDRAALNLGGMANLTWIPRGGLEDLSDVRACDTGPGNSLMDALAEKATGRPMDQDGRLAAQGRVLPELLAELLAHPFLEREPPKSTGREEFGRPLADSLWGRGSAADLLRTAAAFSAEAVARHLARWLRGPAELVVGGGGVRNPVLMEEIARRLPPGVSVRLFDDFGVPSQGREAMAFAILGHRTMHARPSSLPAATGASRPAVLGKISWP
ncbi:MAG TPA: anhydro-N-acetylmuramic acid kinase [Candidatus Nitrosotenuis sp.]|jgi:anhydro-N-acetylmuramic acid kinase|nr:anhydro-N-acetylmuramic acid kinase [Candidatus Nitrosotenuis sp.]